MANSEERDPAQEALGHLRRLEALISGHMGPVVSTSTKSDLAGLADITVAASRTASSIRMVATALALGQDVSGYEDEFWVQAARQELHRVARNRERVLHAATRALAGKRMHRTRVREMAIAMLTAAEHPAFTDPLVRLIPVERIDGGQATTA
jgi:hypothetical protein